MSSPGDPRRTLRAATLALFLALACAAPASAERIWQPATPLTPPGITGQNAQLVYTSDGAVVASWVQYASADSPFPMSARIAIKRPGEPVGPAKVLDDEAGGTPVFLGTDAHGRALGAW